MIPDKDFYELKIEVKETMAKLTGFIEGAVAHRKIQSDKLDAIIEYIGSLNERCLSRTAEYLSMGNHIAESKEHKSFIRDKGIQLIIGLIVAAFTFLVGLIKVDYDRQISVLKSELSREAVANERAGEVN
jgi:hypothetical protein